MLKPRTKKRGDCVSETEMVSAATGDVGDEGHRESDRRPVAHRHKTNGRATHAMQSEGTLHDHAADGGGVASETESTIASICRDLQILQRHRQAAIKSRIKIDNQITATVARFFGYNAFLEAGERERLWKQANSLIKAINSDGEIPIPETLLEVAGQVDQLVINSTLGSDGLQAFIDAHDKKMAVLVKSLPVWPWVESVRGFGATMLAVIIGECGDLSLYANPAKVWRRMGCAPFKNRMGSTWKLRGGLSAEEWTEYGYSPRRRSIVFNLGECLIKNNDGVYRQRYDAVKTAKLALESEEWPKMRCHRHASLLCAKMALRDLWVEWNKVGR